MKVFVVSDMEGVSGVVKWEQVDGGEPLYEEARKLYTEEINAAVRGAKAAGADEIVVMDCHGAGKGWSFNSLVPELLDPDCEWVVQDEWTEYTELLEQGCDAALFVAMHSKAGSDRGVMSHTISGRDYRDLRFNGVSVGETGINAALCGTWGCPVVLVTGDDVACREATELLGPEVVTVAVKQALGRHSARNLPPVRARELIEAAAKEAVEKRGSVPPYDPGRPCDSSPSSLLQTSPTATASATESSASIRSPSPRGPRTGGPPGASSSSDGRPWRPRPGTGPVRVRQGRVLASKRLHRWTRGSPGLSTGTLAKATTPGVRPRAWPLGQVY